jgi:hypothetical protein
LIIVTFPVCLVLGNTCSPNTGITFTGFQTSYFRLGNTNTLLFHILHSFHAVHYVAAQINICSHGTAAREWFARAAAA